MRHLTWFLVVSCCFFASLVIRAEAATPSSAQTTADTVAVRVAENVPVSVPAPTEKALRHYRTGNFLWLVRIAWELALSAAFLFGGFSARLRDFARGIGRNWYFTLCIYLIVIVLLNYAANWPLDYYQGFIRPHAYGLSEQTFTKWFGDSLKELAVTVVLGVLFLWLPCLLLKKSPRRWWLYAGLAMIPVYFFVQLVNPVVFEPLFNEITPIQNKVIEAKILALADRAGIHGSRVFEVRKSVDTKTVNAYVTGFLGTKRIVLWDTILAKLDEHELLFVMGHEMGHYVLNHVVKGILFLSALTFAAFYGVHRAAPVLIKHARGRLGFDQLSDIAALPLIALLLGLFSLLLTPVGFAYSRHLEHEADRFGLEITHNNHSAATGFTRLQEENLGVPRPGPVFTLLRATHPSIGDRIDFFNRYKPWENGGHSKYELYFKSAGDGN